MELPDNVQKVINAVESNRRGRIGHEEISVLVDYIKAAQLDAALNIVGNVPPIVIEDVTPVSLGGLGVPVAMHSAAEMSEVFGVPEGLPEFPEEPCGCEQSTRLQDDLIAASWQLSRCGAIAVGVRDWREPSDLDSVELRAVRKLRVDYERMMDEKFMRSKDPAANAAKPDMLRAMVLATGSDVERECFARLGDMERRALAAERKANDLDRAIRDFSALIRHTVDGIDAYGIVKAIENMQERE